MKEKFLTYLKKYIVGAATAIFLAVMSFAYYLFPASGLRTISWTP